MFLTRLSAPPEGATVISFYFVIEGLGPGTFKQFVFTNTSSELPIKGLPACNVKRREQLE